MGKKISLPSLIADVSDIPRITNLKVEFKYNFWEKDESTNDLPVVTTKDNPHSLKVKKQSINSPNKEIKDDTLKTKSHLIPRYAKITWNPVNSNKLNQSSGNVFKVGNLRPESISLRKNYDKIVQDIVSDNDAFSPIDFQDVNVDDKLSTLVEQSYHRKISKFNTQNQEDLDGKIKLFLKSGQNTSNEKANILNNSTPSSVEDLTMQVLNDIDKLNTSFIDKDEETELVNDVFESVKKFSGRMNINNKFISDILKSSAEDPFSLYSEELQDILGPAEQKQKDAISSNDALSITSDQLRMEISGEPIKNYYIRKGDFEPIQNITGYIIDKKAILHDGSIKQYEPIIIEDAKTSVFYDFETLYGITYIYSIKTVIAFTTALYNFSAKTTLIASKPSERHFIEFHETIAPPPPVDFTTTFDYQNQAARLMWSMPANKQRDIKRFQIYKRYNINEPFMLIKEFNFDNSDVLYESYDQTPKYLEEEVKTIAPLYLDYDFNKDVKTIYAVCSIDAHGISSNYSNQFEVSFNRQTNKMIKRQISRSNAPKQYPNFFLSDNYFVDAIRDSDHTRVKVYLDPEYLYTTNGISNDKKELFVKKDNGKYILQFLNVDLQQGKTVDIIIDNNKGQ